MPTWFTYIVECRDRSLYTGVTTDLIRRVSEHNGLSGVNKGARYTRSRKPVKLVYSEALQSRSLACQREAQIKKLSRQQKTALIKD